MKELRSARALYFSNKAAKLSRQGSVFQVLKSRDKSEGQIKILDPIVNEFVSDDKRLCDIFLKKFCNKVESFQDKTELDLSKISSRFEKVSDSWDIGLFSEDDTLT